MNLMRAVVKAFEMYSEDENNEGAKNAKEQLKDTLLADPTQRRNIAALALLAGTKIQNKLIELLPEFDKMSDEDKGKNLDKILPRITKGDMLDDAVDLIWLGTLIGGIVASKMDFSKTKDEAEDKIDAALKTLDLGPGNCSVCGQMQTLKALGKNNSPICAKCASEDMATIQDSIQKRLKEMGVEAHVVAGGVFKEGDTTAEEVIKESIRQHKDKDGKDGPQDISKFN